ncbi:MAG: FAD-dependent oxidoreductase [Bacteroidetes bacterium]|nr:FAD-dependent oxidoreductase [Bacteroidota bacterium]
MKSVGIIGGGIIGLSSAYYLNKAGFKVTIIDQGDFQEGCSFGNAGMVVPSHIIPLASPGMIAKGIRWMFNSRSPFYVHPRINGELLRWGWQFYRHSTEDHVRHSIPALKELSLFSKSLYREWSKELPFEFGYQERGLIMLYQRADTEKEEVEAAHVANEAGVEAKVLSPEEVQKLEPDVRVTVKGGVYYPGDAHLTPQILVGRLIEHLKSAGVTFMPRTVIRRFGVSMSRITSLETESASYTFDEVVLATGSWSGTVAAGLGLTLPMQAGKGYSFTLPKVEKNIRIPSILLEGRVAVTPMGESLRFGGTMEITGVDHSINMNRVRGIVETIPKYYPEMKVAMPDKKEVWHGLRPCSPDGLPYIGRIKKWDNVVVATGHAMMGLSLGPGTGKLVSQLITEEHTSIPVASFDPERYA